MKRNLCFTLTVWTLSLAGLLHAESLTLETAPPVVVKTTPVAGATGVDAGLAEIKVIYSKAMRDESWSWSTWGGENYPETTGAPKYLADNRTCVLPVKLKPGKFYAIWLNSEKFHGFQDPRGRPAVPYLLTFTTGDAAGSSGTEGEAVMEREVNQLVSHFPGPRVLTTPEAACATWQRANARKDAAAVCELSLVPLDPKEQADWFAREEKRDPEGLAIYLKALADSKILVVQTYRDELANVITFLPFPEGKGSSPYSARCFGWVNGEWKNLGEDRLPTLEAAKANFERKKERLWEQFADSKAKAASTPVVRPRKFVRVVLDEQRMTFEGEPVKWASLELSAVPVRERTVLEWAVPSTQVTLQQQAEWSTHFAGLARQYGFEYASYVGVHPFGSKGGTPPAGQNMGPAPATDAELPLLLNDDQKAVLAWTDRGFRGLFDNRTFDGWSVQERADLETRCIDALKGPRSQEYYRAINTLAALHSTNAFPALRGIAFERVDRNNRDRWMAIRALGLIPDPSAVPELIHLVYHGNINTRWWAQISLVRITGRNFGKDWTAWGEWWNAQKGEPPYQPEIIRWWNGQAEPDKLAASLEESDRKFLGEVAAKP